MKENKYKLVLTRTQSRKISWKYINQRPNGIIQISLDFLVTTFKQSDERESIKNQLKISKMESDSNTRKSDSKKPNKESKTLRNKMVASFTEDTY
jgi:hypothetical protein